MTIDSSCSCVKADGRRRRETGACCLPARAHSQALAQTRRAVLRKSCRREQSGGATRACGYKHRPQKSNAVPHIKESSQRFPAQRPRATAIVPAIPASGGQIFWRANRHIVRQESVQSFSGGTPSDEKI